MNYFYGSENSLWVHLYVRNFHAPIGALVHSIIHDFREHFDVVFADPPYLSEECLTKVWVSHLDRPISVEK